MSQHPSPKPVNALGPADLETCGVWEFTLREKAVGPNEGQVRPRPEVTQFDTSTGTGVFAVRTVFELKSGGRFLGYCTPVEADVRAEHRLGYLAPAIVTDAGQVPFWYVVHHEPGDEAVARAYHLLGGGADEVFPVKWVTDIPAAGGAYYDGDIEAFHFLVYRDGEFSLVLLT